MTGSIKTYTPNFKMIIPEFNIATWHDYIEENFRSIDALFHNLFGINGFSGMWKTNSQYTNEQVLFVGEDNGSMYEGRLVKVINDTNTGGFATFSEAIKRYPSHYEMYADASSAEIFATLAQDWATKTGSTIKTPTGEDTGEYSAKHHAQLAAQHEEACEMYRNLAKTDSDLAKASEVHATEQAQIAVTQATSATTSATNAKTSETNAKTSETDAQKYSNSAQSYATFAKTYAEDAEESATTAATAANSVNVLTVVTNISAINNCSNNMSAIKDAPNQANRAKQYADQAQTLTEGTLNETQITNCITEIPQDIRLELNSGTLTLAQGCKGYMGDGAIRNTTSTPTLKNTGSAQMYLHITSDGTGLYAGYMTGGTVSERPSFPINYATYYNTITKKCEYYNGSTWSEISLPIAIVTRGADGFTSIDQVFNGFGYIGSTVFALPGVKGLVPNGRNADGTLKNTEYTVPNVITFERSLTGDNIPVFLRGNNTFAISTGLIYDEVNNIVGTGGYFQVGNIDMNAGVVSNLRPKMPFRTVDYNDTVKYSNKATVVSWSIPDRAKAVSVSTGASYTAPSNGWLYVNITGQRNTNEKIVINIGGIQYSYGRSLYDNQLEDITAEIFISKGDVCTFTVTGTWTVKFIPCKGV